MTPIERNESIGVFLFWRDKTADWILDTPDGRLYLGELSGSEAIAEFDAAVRRAIQHPKPEAA